MRITYLKQVIIVLMLVSVSTLSFAEDAAPVFDADSMPSQFDGQQASDNNSASSVVVTPAASSQQEQSYFPSPTLTMEQRLAKVEQQLVNMQRSTSSAKADSLQGEVQSLRGQVEQLNHEIQQLQAQNQQLQKQIHAQYADLEKRLNKPSSAQKTLAATDEVSPADDTSKDTKKLATNTTTVSGNLDTNKATENQQPNMVEEQQTYEVAYDLIKAKKYNEAIDALQKMLKKYPSGQFAANAHYWLGELYGLTGKNEQSINEFGTIINNFPESPKVPNAQLKLGMILASELKWKEAKTAFKKVVSRYPGTASAHLASEQLKQLKQSGH